MALESASNEGSSHELLIEVILKVQIKSRAKSA
jgi:hypothetical protein